LELSDIENALNEGRTVIASEQPILFHGIAVCGYIVIDPHTGAGAYMISEGFSGGRAVLGALNVINEMWQDNLNACGASTQEALASLGSMMLSLAYNILNLLQSVVSLSYDTTLFVCGQSLSADGERVSMSFIDLVGGSLSLQIGDQIPSDQLYSEYGLGLGQFLGVGFYFTDTNLDGQPDLGGLSINAGIGVGFPVYFAGYAPVGENLGECE
jgi:hypothetical protein